MVICKARSHTYIQTQTHIQHTDRKTLGISSSMGQKTPIIVYPFLSAFLPLYLSACLFDSDPDACLSVCSTSLSLFLSPSAFVSLLLYLSMAPESHILVCPSIPSSLAPSLCLCIFLSSSPILCLSACVMMN